jgi:tetratricopeptide (TPR) repeat protein
MERATRKAPEMPSLWSAFARLLAKSNRMEKAIQAATKAIDLAAARADLPPQFLPEAFMQRSILLQQQNRAGEARADYLRAKNIPSRDSATPPKLIDLTPYYNAGLEESWHHRRDWGNNLAMLDKGCQNLGGSLFDVRGIIQLAGERLKLIDPSYPDHVQGIQVARRCGQVHFLHATGWSVADGIVIGRYVVHYADGKTQEIPIVYGEDVRDWHIGSDRARSLKHGLEISVGVGKNAPGDFKRLFESTWENPRPDAAIVSLDFISTMTQAAPFLIAITIEP